MVLKKKMRAPYLERPLEARVKTNLKLAKRLFEKREYSSSVMRSVIAAEVLVNGLIYESLGSSVGGAMPKNILKKLNFAEKLTWCFESLFGFSTSKAFPVTFREITRSSQQRNQIAHEGTLAERKDAVKAYAATIALIKKVSKRVGVSTQRLESYLKQGVSASG